MVYLTPLSGDSGWIARNLILLLSCLALSSWGFVIDPETRPSGSSPSLLRVMPLGASITAGYRSTDGNGYRKWIHDQLEFENWEVDMVGSMRSGTMKDNDHEGHFGFRVDQIATVVEKSLHLKPNLILINAGTNDAIQSHDVDSIGERMDALLTRLFDSIPETVIVLSTLLPNKRHETNINNINKQYIELVAKRRADGYRVVLADMNTFIPLDHLVDGIHPTDAGYEQMAAVWWGAISDAQVEKMLQKPTGASFASMTNETESSTANPNLLKLTAAPQPVLNNGVHGYQVCIPISALLGLSVFLGAML